MGAAINDGTSPNRKCFRLHSNLAADPKCDVVYKTPSGFSTSRVHLLLRRFTTSDENSPQLPHNSGSGSCSRYIWNDRNYLLFRHIANLFNSDQEFALHSLPKITMDHIVLTSYSKMKVKLATQVLSKSIAISLRDSDNDEVPGTVTFCEMMNDMFDCTNVRSKTEHARKTRKYFIKPYTSCDDERFVSMKNVVLKYLENWRESILSRPEKYTADERGKIFIWMQTYEGLKNLKIYLTTAVMFFKIIQVCPDYPWTSFAAELVYVVK